MSEDLTRSRPQEPADGYFIQGVCKAHSRSENVQPGVPDQLSLQERESNRARGKSRESHSLAALPGSGLGPL